MSFAVRNDGRGFWSVAGPEEVGADEWYSMEVPSETLPSVEEVAQAAIDKRNSLLAAAATRMGPLQDAVDAGRATEQEAARLMLWKGYRIDLNRIESQERFPTEIVWPFSPDELPAPEETPSEAPDA